MRHLPLMLTIAVLLATIALAQAPAAQTSPARDAGPRSFVLRLAEFRLPEGADPTLAAGEIVRRFGQLQQEGALDLVQTLRLRGVEGEDAMARIGASVPVPFETTDAATGATTRAERWQDTGTIVRFAAEPSDGVFRLTLSYDASRLTRPDHPERAADGPGHPERPIFSVDTSLVLEAGVPTLVAGSSDGDSTYLIVMIEE